MNILAVADVHGTASVSSTISEQIERTAADLVLVCGDITQFGPPPWAANFLDSIPIKTLAIPGNCDPHEVIATIEESKAIPLHGKKHMIDDVTFCGFGGSNPTPFGTLLEFTEDEIFSGLDDIMETGCVLAVHAPARGHLDTTPSTSDLGSKAISDIVKKYSPKLVISAHIHEARGVERDDHTTFINPGPASKGYAALIKLRDHIVVELIQD
jgi:Icc-related predicted phosphoesterase